MSEIEREQAHLDYLHQQLTERRAAADQELTETFRQATGTRQALLERGVSATRLSRLIARYDAAENGLCFGRLDLDSGERRYLGRIGLRAEDRYEDPILIDWRAPAARPFYTATAATPQGVTLRRHLRVRGRRVTALDDELLDGTGTPPADVELTGEAALMAVLRADRTGRMQGAVATLQAEQDRIIRSPHAGVLVVQGGPGTGKTVVALHRAAYLLYSRPNLENRGVLVVGPNAVFLSYIGDVLPGLGESSVLLSSVGEFFPGVTPDREEPDAVAARKGRLEMAEVIGAALRARQAAVDGPVEVMVGGELLVLEPAEIELAAQAARAGQQPHNRARKLFRENLISQMAHRLARVAADLQEKFEAELHEQIDSSVLDRAAAADLSQLLDGPDDDSYEQAQEHETAVAEQDWRQTLSQDDAVLEMLDRLWPSLTPQQLLEDLFAGTDDPLLHRERGSGWSVEDVPLLDEAAELLGVDDTARLRREAARRAAQVEFAQGVLDVASGSRAQENEVAENAETLSAADVVDAAQLADWNDEGDRRTVAERAAADRTWVFGHVIVDEAQELSPMTWRLLVRRCPTRSFTVVGDIAQSSLAAGSTSWPLALAPFFEDRWRLERLTVNYRTPVEIMTASDRVLAAIHPELEPARAVRSTGVPPYRLQTDDLAGRVAELAESEAEVSARVAVIVPETSLEKVSHGVQARMPEASWGRAVDLEARVVVLTARQAKGLEFDSVVLGDPAAILGASARGLNDLYVALTRASQRLLVVHSGPVPELLAHLEPI